MIYRVEVLVDGEDDRQKALDLLREQTETDKISEYDGLVTGLATDEGIQQLRDGGLRVEASSAFKEATEAVADVQAQVEQLAPRLDQSAEPPALRLELRGPLRPKWKQLMEEAQVEMLGKVDVNTYLVRGTSGAVRQLATNDFLRNITLDSADEKLSDDVRKAMQRRLLEDEMEGVPGEAMGGMLDIMSSPAAPVAPPLPTALYDISTHNAGETPSLLQKLGTLPNVVIEESAPTTVRIRTTQGSAVLNQIKTWPEVCYLAEFTPAKFACGRGAMTIGFLEANPAQPTLRVDLPWTGKGEVVAVLDSGIDEKHPDLKTAMQGSLPMPNARPTDDIGHGTHVAGIIAGRGTKKGPKGIAPKAKLISRAMIDGEGRLLTPVDYADLFKPVVDAGATIFNLSWGFSTGGSYFEGSRQLDQFAYEHPDVLFVVAAGNEGAAKQGTGDYEYGTVAAPGSAKNALTVGATGLRCHHPAECTNCQLTTGQKWPPRFSLPPAANLTLTPIIGGPVSVVGISSRGPTDFNSVKPDLVAPGVAVESTRSQFADDARFEAGCPMSSAKYYGCKTGTSMATPFVSGAAALIRQFIRQKTALDKPSSALLKALLIACTQPLDSITPQINDLVGTPDFDQGFGLLNIRTLLEPAVGQGLLLIDIDNQSPLALASRQPVGAAIRSYRTHAFTVPANPTGPLSVVLCWNDPPGVSIQNNLQLDMATPAGERLYGNQGHKFMRNPLSVNLTDHYNNVERIRIDAPTPGTYTVRVFAENTSLPNQGYSLAVSGAVTANVPEDWSAVVVA